MVHTVICQKYHFTGIKIPISSKIPNKNLQNTKKTYFDFFYLMNYHPGGWSLRTQKPMHRSKGR